MSVQKFRVGSSSSILAQPSTEKIYARSTDAADTGNLTLTGEIAATPDSEVLALLGQREVLTIDDFDSLTAAILSAAQAGVVSIYSEGTAANGYIIGTTQPANNDTIVIGLTGFTQTYTFKTSLTGAAYEVLRGADVTASMVNLRRAIRDGDAVIGDGTGEATLYGTGTAAHPYATISAISGTILTLTDRVPCRRQLAWSLSQGVGATLSLLAPIGGIDGTLLATMAAAVTASYTAFSLASEDLVATTLPALLGPTTDALSVGGRPATLRFKVANITTAIPVIYQTSTDGTNWATGLTAITNLDNMSVAVPQFVHPSEANIEYIRLVFGANTNTTDTPLDACVIS